MGRHTAQPKKENPVASKKQPFTLPHPKNIAALAAVSSIIVGGSGFAMNNNGDIQAVESHATPENIEAEAAPTVAVEAANNYSDDQVVLSTVDFYRKVCPSLSNLTSVTRNMSVTVEEAVGKEGQDLADFWSGQLHTKSKGLHDSADSLQQLSNKYEVDPVPVATVTEKAHGIAFAFTEYANTCLLYTSPSPRD